MSIIPEYQIDVYIEGNQQTYQTEFLQKYWTRTDAVQCLSMLECTMYYCSFEIWGFVGFCSASVVSILDWVEALVSLLLKLSKLRGYMLLSTSKMRADDWKKALLEPITYTFKPWFLQVNCPIKPMLKGSPNINHANCKKKFQIRMGSLKAISKVHALFFWSFQE